ncbi:MAG: type II secretion system protein [Planctomycetes bacterium]|nr:type II secretion system protein [Planctomycetota bacterium]
MAPSAQLRSGGRRAARLGQRAFTLIEITVVTLLIGLFLMVVLTGTYFAFRDRETLKGEARALAGFLETVRTNAAIKGKTHRVEYNLKEQLYFVWFPRKAEEGEVFEGDDDDAYVAGAYFEMPSRTGSGGQRVFSCWIDRVAFGDASVVKDDVVKIDFAPRGGGSWHYVYLTNQEGEFYTISLNPFTGSADYYPGEMKIPPPERLK